MKQLVRRLKKLRRLVTLGAQHYLVGTYLNRHLDADDVTNALYWYLQAATAGQCESQCALGRLLFLGEGVPHEVDVGLQWLSRAAQSDHLASISLLGHIYLNRVEGIPEDRANSVQYFE